MPIPLPEKKIIALAPSPVEFMEPVLPSDHSREADLYWTTIIQHGPGRTGPGARISASASVLFLLGTAALLASASSINDYSRIEPVQTRAKELFDRSERTYQASYLMGGLAVASALTALLYYMLEEPDAPQGLSVRF